MKTEINYSELARRVGDCILNNDIMPELQAQGFDFELYNGKDDYCYKHETEEECEKNDSECDYEYFDIYQNYIITENGAKYLAEHTNEIVYYCEKVNMYIWGITHFGTSWDGVFTTIKK